MGWYIRVENKADLDWFQGLMDRQLMKWKDGTSLPENLDLVEIVSRLADACAQAKPTTQGTLLDVPKDVIEKDKAAEKSNAKPGSGNRSRYGDGSKKPRPEVCKVHPYYAGKRAPRGECEGCWTAYKKFHPLEYKTARAKFERKLKNALL